jgi:hypothetical protein
MWEHEGQAREYHIGGGKEGSYFLFVGLSFREWEPMSQYRNVCLGEGVEKQLCSSPILKWGWNFLFWESPKFQNFLVMGQSKKFIIIKKIMN